MKRELAAFFHAISDHGTLVLFVDDLHWADTSTVDMIAYRASKLADMRLLVVATYRPSEMLLSKYLFLAVVLDLPARSICQELPLPFLTRDDVDQYLVLEFRRHDFPQQFASLIFTKTKGSPLFMTDVVRYLRDRRVIGTKKADGRSCRRSWRSTTAIPRARAQVRDIT